MFLPPKVACVGWGWRWVSRNYLLSCSVDNSSQKKHWQ